MSFRVKLCIALAVASAALAQPAAAESVPVGDGCSPATEARCRKQCEAGNGVACFDLAWMYETGWYGKRDPARAGNYHRRAVSLLSVGCDAHVERDCYALAVLVASGLGAEKDRVRAVELLVRACGSFGAACTNLASHYQTGDGVELDSKKAAALFQRACDLGHGTGCAGLARMFEDGVPMPRDLERAAQLLQRGCELGSGGACKLIGLMYDQGRIVRKDPRLAFARYRRGCALWDEGSCTNAGMMLYQGEGTETDEVEGLRLMQLGCDHGCSSGCANVRAARSGATKTKR